MQRTAPTRTTTTLQVEKSIAIGSTAMPCTNPHRAHTCIDRPTTHELHACIYSLQDRCMQRHEGTEKQMARSGCGCSPAMLSTLSVLFVCRASPSASPAARPIWLPASTTVCNPEHLVAKRAGAASFRFRPPIATPFQHVAHCLLALPSRVAPRRTGEIEVRQRSVGFQCYAEGGAGGVAEEIELRFARQFVGCSVCVCKHEAHAALPGKGKLE